MFLAGCGLPAAWVGRRRFTVGELGLGTGLSLAALLDLWRRHGPADGFLHIFSVEAHPITAGQAATVLSAWPELAPVAGPLIRGWPGRARGFHRIDLPGLRAVIDVAVLEAGEALARWDGRADAWFLDGFAPSRNPDMWRPEVLRAVAGHSAPGARLASWTAAAAVRRDLQAAGLAVERKPGFGRKTHRIEARAPGTPSSEIPPPRVVIVGAGIAGACLARAFRALGVAPSVVGEDGPGRPAGPPAAVVAPRLDAGLGGTAALFAQAACRARRVYDEVPGAVLSSGAVQLATGPKDPGRFARIAGSDLFEPGAMQTLPAAVASARLGEPAPGALRMVDAAVVAPDRLLGAWTGGAIAGRVAALARAGSAWRVLDPSGALLAEAEIVCLAAGLGCAPLVPGLPLSPVRGQASMAPGVASPDTALFGGYIMNGPEGLVFGSTHDRGDADPGVRTADQDRNLAMLGAALPKLAARARAAPLTAWAGVRATTPDFLPVAGEAGEGLHVLCGLGSRGYTLAPLLAEHVAAKAFGAPSPLPADLAALVAPGRFAERARRRGRAVIDPVAGPGRSGT